MNDDDAQTSPNLGEVDTTALPKNVKDERGKAYGRWKVLRTDLRRNSANQIMWWCQCSCPDKTVREVSGTALRTDQSLSCGCLQKEITSQIFTTHGLTGTVIYVAWKSMMDRCYSDKYIDFADYGGRGITVCERWHDVHNFSADMLPTWKEGLSLDRIDTDGNYCPENCRWATKEQQENNKRNNRRVTAFGKTQTVAQWSRETGLSHSLILKRLNRNWDPERALTEPSQSKNKNAQ